MRSHQQRVRVFLCLGLMLSTLLETGIAFLLEAKSPPLIQDAFVTLRIPLTLAAGGFLAAGAFVSLRRAYTASLLLIQGCALLGLVLFFVGLTARELLFFSGVTLAGQGLLVLPKVLQERSN